MKKILIKIIRDKKFLLAAGIAWLALLIVLSLVPYDSELLEASDDQGFRIDYLQHFAGYLVLGILATLWRLDREKLLSLPETILVLAFGLLISFLLEYAQVFVPGRSFNMIDVVFNLSGMAAGIVLTYLLIGRLVLGPFSHDPGE